MYNLLALLLRGLLAEATPEASAGAKDLVYSYSSGGFSTVTLNEHFFTFRSTLSTPQCTGWPKG